MYIDTRTRARTCIDGHGESHLQSNSQAHSHGKLTRIDANPDRDMLTYINTSTQTRTRIDGHEHTDKEDRPTIEQAHKHAVTHTQKGKSVLKLTHTYAHGYMDTDTRTFVHTDMDVH